MTVTELVYMGSRIEKDSWTPLPLHPPPLVKKFIRNFLFIYMNNFHFFEGRLGGLRWPMKLGSGYLGLGIGYVGLV